MAFSAAELGRAVAFVGECVACSAVVPFGGARAFPVAVQVWVWDAGGDRVAFGGGAERFVPFGGSCGLVLAVLAPVVLVVEALLLLPLVALSALHVEAHVLFVLDQAALAVVETQAALA